MGAWQSNRVELTGGIQENVSPLQQGISQPGSLIVGVNMEPALDGGYSRILGHELFNTTQCPSGSENILGVWEYKDAILAFADDTLWSVTEDSAVWTSKFTNVSVTGVTATKAARNNWGTTPRYIFVNGVKSFYWDDASSGVLDSVVDTATSVVTFHNRMWFAVGAEVYATNFETIGTIPGDFLTGLRMRDEILDMAVWRDALYVFGREFITKITGYDDADIAIEEISTRLGVLKENTVQEIAGNLMFLSADGIRTVAGTDKIGDTALTNLSYPVAQRVDNLKSAGADINMRSVVLHEKGQYRLYASSASLEALYTPGVLAGLRGDSQGNLSMEFFDLKGVKPYSMNSDYFAGNERMFFGTYDGYIMQQTDNSYSFSGTDVDWEIQMPYWVLTEDDPDLRKVLFKLKLYASSPAGTTGTLGYYLNYLGDRTISPASQAIEGAGAGFLWDSGVEWDQASLTYTSSLSATSLHNLQGSCQNVSFRIFGSDSLTPHTFKSLLLQYSVEGKL
jgi:hypothetical protein